LSLNRETGLAPRFLEKDLSILQPKYYQFLNLPGNKSLEIVVSLVKGMSWNFVAVPLEAWSGPEGSRKLRFPYFMTTAQDGVKVVSLWHRPPLPPGNTTGTHFC
jgi:hypothetical protein